MTEGLSERPLLQRVASLAPARSRCSLDRSRDLLPLGRLDPDVIVPAAGPVHFFCKFHGPHGQNGQLLVSDD